MTTRLAFHTHVVLPLLLAWIGLGAGLYKSPDLAVEFDMPLKQATSVAPDTNEKIVIIERTQKLSRSTANGEPVQVLEVDVMLSQPDKDTLYLWARKVTKFEARDEVLLEGNVLIVQNNDSLSADRVRYFSNVKEGRARGNVRLSDGEVQVFAPSALHYFDEKHTIFDQNVRLVDSATVLTSLDGEYFSDEKRAEFYGEVVLVEDQTYLEADSVTYFRDTEVSIGVGDVFIERIGGDQGIAPEDSTTRTFLFGDKVYNDNRAGYSKMDGNAMLFQFKQDSTGANVDSLIMSAHSMESLRQDSLQRLIAVDSVQIWQTDFSAIADSAVYDRISIEGQPLNEENRLYENPLAWFESYQLSGDTMRATALAGEIDSLYVLSNAFAADQDTATMRINQLRGKHLLGFFAQDSLKSLSIGPQAESIYFKQSDDDQLGAIKSTGDRIELRFKNNEVNQIGVYSGIQGDYYDGNLIPEPFQLDGFVWQPEKKPDQKAMMQGRDRLQRIMNRMNIFEVPEFIESPLSESDNE